jgi:hypothetical protein
MSHPTVEKIRVKVIRAEQHIQDFQRGLAAFVDTKPYAISVKEDARSEKRIHYVSKADPVPDALAAVAADAIQNLRAVLDQIAYQLVLAERRGTPPDWKVYFPITGSAASYKATRGGFIKCVRQEIIDAIDATEAYKGGNPVFFNWSSRSNTPQPVDRMILEFDPRTCHGSFRPIFR